MGLKLISPPATEPLTLAEAKAHLRITDTDNDTMVAALIEASRRHAEVFLGRAIVDQTWDLVLDSFPTGTDMEIKIPKPPLISVTQIAYDQTSGIEAIVDPSRYYVDNVSEPGWVVPIANVTWPTPLSAINSVRVRFRAGYMDTNSPPQVDVPEDIKSAIKLMLGSLYEQRESMSIGRSEQPYLLPWSAEQILRQHRIELSMA